MNYHVMPGNRSARRVFRLWVSLVHGAALGIMLGFTGLTWPRFELGLALCLALPAVAAVFIFCALVSLVARPLLDRRRSFLTPGLCRHCGYDLRGLPDRRCPECGTPFDLYVPVGEHRPAEPGDKATPADR